jgi:N-acetylmuramoyl-L-alanine amidase
MGFDVIQDYIEGRNRPETRFVPLGIVVHSTANPGSTAKNNRDYFNNHTGSKSSAHAVIDWSSIIAVIPCNEVAFHAGPTANATLLGIELCEPWGDDEYSQFDEVWNRAVWFVAQKCLTYGWATDDVYSHRGISQMYGETDHTDPIGFFAKYGKTWDEFLQAVEQEMKGEDTTQTITVIVKEQKVPAVLVGNKTYVELDAYVKATETKILWDPVDKVVTVK